MNNYTFVSLLLLSVAFLPACRKSGSGLVVQETYPLSAFTRLESSGTYNLFIIPNDTPRVVVEVDDNLQSLFKVEQSGSTLNISTRRDYRNSTQNNVYVYVPSLEYLKVSGTGNLRTMSSIIVPRFEYVFSGTGDAKMSSSTAELLINISGTGKTTWDGETRRCNLIHSGTGNFEGFALGSDTLALNNSGTGNIEVTVNNAFSIINSGTGDIIYDGQPVITSLNNTGTGTIRRR